MNGNCNKCDVEQQCAYEYKPCDCCNYRKFKPKPETEVKNGLTTDPHELALNLEGVIADVELGGGFDEVCMSTVKWVRECLLAMDNGSHGTLLVQGHPIVLGKPLDAQLAQPSYVSSGEPDYKGALMVWLDKTEWVQETGSTSELGMHRADVIKARIEKLEAQRDDAVAKVRVGHEALKNLVSSLCGEKRSKDTDFWFNNALAAIAYMEGK